jgi:REP element-mobilizing transposase RayT
MTRPPLNHRHPVHVTLSLRESVGNLRTKLRFRAIRRALERGKERFGFRVIQFSAQRDHLHIVAEAQHRVSLSRGLQGLGVRIAKAINRTLARRGQVLRDRYHARALKSPREVRASLVYVLNNARKHGQDRGAVPRDLSDYEFSSAPYFKGWSLDIPWQAQRGPPPVAEPQSWLLTTGWLRWHPKIHPSEVPGA